MNSYSLSSSLTAARSIPETVAAYLRQGILTGVLPAGAQLKQGHLAKHFGTSNAPVREALQTLAGEGLLTISRHRGITVAAANPADLLEITELRALLEGHAMRLSVPLLTQADLTEAGALLDEAEASPPDTSLQADLHWRFHRVLLSRAARPRVLAQIESLHITVSRYLLPAWTAAGLSIGWVEAHRFLLELAAHGQADGAAERNAWQIEEARARVAAWLTKQETA